MGDFKAVLFDFDGVIVDSEPFHLMAWEDTMRGFERSFPSHRGGEFVGVPDDQIALSLVADFSLPIKPHQLLEKKREVFSGYICKDLHMYEDLKNMLCLLTGKKLGVVTSSGASIVIPSLRSFGVLDVFQTVVCADDVLVHKPAPDPYLFAATRLGVATNSCVVVEDSPPGIASGKAAGMFVIGVTTTVGPNELKGADVIRSSTSEAVQWMVDNGIF